MRQLLGIATNKSIQSLAGYVSGVYEITHLWNVQVLRSGVDACSILWHVWFDNKAEAFLVVEIVSRVLSGFQMRKKRSSNQCLQLNHIINQQQLPNFCFGLVIGLLPRLVRRLLKQVIVLESSSYRVMIISASYSKRVLLKIVMSALVSS